jgi:peptidoglycan/LPS O-acetylase OafA/YrhL
MVQTTDREMLPALTSLRFFAAFAVVLLHYRDLLGPIPPEILKAMIGGQYGVTFFFVLSGFILTYNYHDWFSAGVNEKSFWRFQRLRFARIYPIYFLGLLLDTPWHLIERVQVGQLANSGHEFFASWLLNLVGLQAWVPGVPYAMFWNTPAWSVSAEFFFYASFPFVCGMLARRIRTMGGLVIALVGVFVLETAIYAGVVYLLNFGWQVSGQTNYLLTTYNPLLRSGEFVTGCLAGLYFIRSRGKKQYWGASVFGNAGGRNAVIALCLIMVAVRVMSPDYTGASTAIWVLDVALKYPIFILPFAAIIVAIASGRNFLSSWLEKPWLVLLGEASYSLYIIHWAGQTFLKLGYLGAYGTPFVHVLFLFATVAASVFFYRVVEVPWRKRLRGTSQATDPRLAPAGPRNSAEQPII